MTLTLPDILFYAFGFLVLFSAIMVISARNPVHSVLFLIFTFFNAAGLFVLIGAEYLAMTLVIVYVGAVAVLFLFVVMMMDIDFAKWREGFIKQLPVGIVVALVLCISLGAVIYAGSLKTPLISLSTSALTTSNTYAIGEVLYTQYAYVFLLSGLVLLVAMVGAIILTLRERTQAKRQSISNQLKRQRKDSVESLQVESGKGVSL